MIAKNMMYAAAAAIALVGAPASAATFDAYSFEHPNENKVTHSVKLGRRLGVVSNKLIGSKGKKKKKFRFEDSLAKVGEFNVDGDTATLTGVIKNQAGQGYEVSMNFRTIGDPGVYKKKRGASRADWSYFELTSGTLTALTEGLASFDLKQHGKKWKNGKKMALATQFGTGANITNLDITGLFTKFRATEQGCDGSLSECQKFNGNLKLALQQRDEAAGFDSVSVGDRYVPPVPLPATAALLPMALGSLVAAGGIARRRRKG